MYLTAIQKSDQDVVDTLCVSEHVLTQFNLYRKSDNTGCYSGNPVAEIIHTLCHKHEIRLNRYDYNEPQNGERSS